MTEISSWLPFGDQFAQALGWLANNAAELSVATFGQAAAITAAYMLAWFLSPLIRRGIGALPKGQWLESYAPLAERIFSPLTLPAVWLSLLWTAVGIAHKFSFPSAVLNLAATLTTAWVVIHLSTSFIRDPARSKALTMLIWTIAAFNIVGLLAPSLEFLDSAAITAGSLRISPLTLIKALLWLAGAIWIASLAARLIERRVSLSPVLTPSMQVLIAKLSNIALIGIAAVVALSAVGIDLTALTVLTGAVGLGVGFGLQKAVANFVSGLSMLLDRSIKPGDVISVGETFGWVRAMGGRYVSVLTRDGLEYLIPNEDLITKQVVNWSLSDNQVRIRTPIGVSYKSDIHKARQLCVEAASETPRVLDQPSAICHLVGFGENSVDLELRFWINDPRNGIGNVKSDVLLNIWDKFKAGGIEFPFPQRDVHLPSPLFVHLSTTASDVGDVGPKD